MTAERIARNDSLFRDANEGISARARERQVADGHAVPFLCECADEECTTLVQLPLGAYEEVRADSRQFLNALGHERAEGLVEVVAKNHNHLVVRKAGRAGDLAEELDPRRDRPRLP